MKSVYGKAVSFLGCKNDEVFVVAGKYHDVPVGTLIKYLLETDESFWEDASAIANALRVLCDNGLQRVVADSASPEYSAEIEEAIHLTNGILSLDAPQLLKELVWFLPAANGFAKAFRDLDLVEPSQRELDEVSRAIDNIHTLDDLKNAAPKIEHFESRVYLDPTAEYAAVKSWWSRWIDCITNEKSIDLLRIELNGLQDRDKLLGVIRQYSRHLRMICADALKMMTSLFVAVGAESGHQSKTAARDELRSCNEGPVLMSVKDCDEVFVGYDISQYEHIYTALSLSSLVSLEMRLLIRHNIEFKECAFCRCYYATHKRNSKYCQYPNPDFGGKTCKDFAANMVFWKRSPIWELYRKNCAAYRRWVARYKTTDPTKMYPQMKNLKRYLDGTLKMEIANSVWAKIIIEIDSRFEKWDAGAKHMLDLYQKGEVSEEMCAAAVALPSVEERSPILASWDGESIDIPDIDWD